MRPIALTCGEPAGIGPETAVAARRRLGASVPFFWIGDPRHLPEGTDWQAITACDQALTVPATVLPPMAVSKNPPATWPREEVRKRAPKALPRDAAG